MLAQFQRAVRPARHTHRISRGLSLADARSIFRDLPAGVASALVTNGYAVWDNAVSREACAKIRSELDALAREPGALTANETLFVTPGGGTRRMSKANIWEAELHAVSDEVRALAPTLDALRYDASLPATISCFQPALTLGEVAVKAQVNSGDGGCFPIHVDSDPAVDRRVVTVLLYVNAGWDSRRDGGDLRLYPFPPQRGQDGGIVRHLDVSPVEGRAVFLSANEMHHRVLPAFSKRYCVTLWLFGKVSGRIPKPAPIGEDCTDLSQIMRLPQYRKHVARVALSKEWESSLEQAHDSEQARVALNAHLEEIEKLRSAVARHILTNFPRVRPDELAQTLQSPECVYKLQSPARETPQIQWLI